MTVASAVSRSGPYTGNGTQTVFAYGFKVFAASDLQVVLRSSSGIETVQTLSTHYTVSGVGSDAGGNVTMVSAPASGQTLTIVRLVPLTQETDLRNQGGFYPEVHERAFDRLTMQVQQVDEELERSLSFPVSDAALEATLPSSAIRANKVLVFDATGAPGVTDVAGLASVTATAFVNVQEFTGNGVAVSFTLQNAPASANAITVSIGGIVQSAVSDYSLAGNVLTFTAAPPNGQLIIVRWITAAGAGTYVPISATVAGTSEVRANGGALNVQGVGSGSGAVSAINQYSYYGASQNVFGNLGRAYTAGGTPTSPAASGGLTGFETREWYGHDGSNFVRGALFAARATAAPSTGSVPMELGWGIGSGSALNVVLRSGGQWRFVPMASAPASPLAGDVYYDSGTNKLRCWNGSTWNDLF
jgi:hypothetical protein